MNLTITVTNPIIQGTQQLKVEYSTDGVNYTLDSYQTSNTFTTSFGGFNAGTLYYFRFTLVKGTSPVIECDPIVKTYKIPEEIVCLDFDAELTQSGGKWYLSISYTTPSPYNAPCGGYILKYGTSFPLTSIAYSTLPASPLVFPTSSQTHYVEIYAVDCAGNSVLCEEFEVTPTVDPCTPATLSSVQLVVSGGFKLIFDVVPSIPASSSYTISYHQVNAVTSGVPDPGGVVVKTATGANPDTFIIPVTPNQNLYGFVVSYAGSVTDGCGNTIPFDVSVAT